MSVVIDTTRVAPRAKRRICVDFDLTLVDWGPLYEVPEPLPGAVEAVRTLVERGYEVVIARHHVPAGGHHREGRPPGGCAIGCVVAMAGVTGFLLLVAWVLAPWIGEALA